MLKLNKKLEDLTKVDNVRVYVPIHLLRDNMSSKQGRMIIATFLALQCLETTKSDENDEYYMSIRKLCLLLRRGIKPQNTKSIRILLNQLIDLDLITIDYPKDTKRNKVDGLIQHSKFKANVKLIDLSESTCVSITSKQFEYIVESYITVNDLCLYLLIKYMIMNETHRSVKLSGERIKSEIGTDFEGFKLESLYNLINKNMIYCITKGTMSHPINQISYVCPYFVTIPNRKFFKRDCDNKIKNYLIHQMSEGYIVYNKDIHYLDKEFQSLKSSIISKRTNVEKRLKDNPDDVLLQQERDTLSQQYKEIKELNDIKRQEERNEKLNPAFGEVVGFKAVNNF